jgi:hypothetical protein
MSKKSKHSFSSVVSVNAYKNTYFKGVSSFITQIDSVDYSKEQYVISYINTKGFINTQISISKNIPEEDLHDAITNKVYDELALDQAVEYKIQFIETFNSLDEENRSFHVFIIDPATIKETFADSVSKVKYIDTIVPSPLLFRSLYEKDLIESSGVHCFIYFQENDAFITIYNEKEFLYTKAINYSYLQMHERFCELYGERIEFSEFMNFVTKHNLKDTDNSFKEYIIKLYKEIFANISDILTYAKRAFELEKIELIYIGSQLNTVTKFDEICEVELSIKTKNLEFDYGLETSEDIYIDQLHALMHIYTTLENDKKYNCNFTIYHRPPEFIQRESGKFILFVVASFVVAFIYPVTYWVLTYAQGLQYDLLHNEYIDLHNKKITREATIKSKEADKAKVLTLLNKEKDDYTEKKNTLIKIHDVKVNYPMKAKLLNNFTKDFNKFSVSMESLTYLQDNSQKVFVFNLVSRKEKRITRLLKYLTKTYENKFKFALDRIEYKEESKRYFSKLKVTIL